MTPRRPAEPEDMPTATTAAAPPGRHKEFTPPLVRGGAYDEDGQLVHETQPESDAHRADPHPKKE